MRTQVLRNESGTRQYVLVFEAGDDVVKEVERLAKDRDSRGAHLTAVGAIEEAVLASFDGAAKKYVYHPVKEQVEVASMTGSLAVAPDGKGRSVDAHVLLGRADGSALAGRFSSGIVQPTLEPVLAQTPRPLSRLDGEETGLALLASAEWSAANRYYASPRCGPL